jgi:hypothetical protein
VALNLDPASTRKGIRAYEEDGTSVGELLSAL